MAAEPADGSHWPSGGATAGAGGLGKCDASSIKRPIDPRTYPARTSNFPSATTNLVRMTAIALIHKTETEPDETRRLALGADEDDPGLDSDPVSEMFLI